MAQVEEISANAQQIEYWNATAGETWAQFQEPLDRQIEPLGLAAIGVWPRQRASISSTLVAGAVKPRWPSLLV